MADMQQPTQTPAAEAETAEAQGEVKKKTLGREIFEWVMVVVVAVAAALLIRTFIFEPVRVDGESMINTLQDGEYMIVTKYDYWLGDPERFDVVICRYPNRGMTNFVKRVVGLPGDEVAVSGGVLYLNGEAVDEPYIDYPPYYTLDPYTVPEGQYFVLGDNRASSNDSHSVGPLARNQIKGHVRLVAWPFSDFRTVE
ncbi:MAG: signal peptidase I [Oscillospiraceae bacterium]|jgi:signal peptidase I|nr:signal peptidase I [Oscillospiraceae bacterium]